MHADPFHPLSHQEKCSMQRRNCLKGLLVLLFDTSYITMPPKLTFASHVLLQLII